MDELYTEQPRSPSHSIGGRLFYDFVPFQDGRKGVKMSENKPILKSFDVGVIHLRFELLPIQLLCCCAATESPTTC